MIFNLFQLKTMSIVTVADQCHDFGGLVLEPSAKESVATTFNFRQSWRISEM